MMVAVAILSVLLFSASPGVTANDRPGMKGTPETTRPEMQGQHGTTGAPVPPGHPPALKATLVKAEEKAKEHAATVQVTVTGVELIDPAAVNEQPKEGQGHLHYRVNGGLIIATTATKLSFHNLEPGEHRILVQLVEHNHKPMGPQELLTVQIPGKEQVKAPMQRAK